MTGSHAFADHLRQVVPFGFRKPQHHAHLIAPAQNLQHLQALKRRPHLLRDLLCREAQRQPSGIDLELHLAFAGIRAVLDVAHARILCQFLTNLCGNQLKLVGIGMGELQVHVRS